ncbi:MAG: ribosome maturation factor RimP [Candidatus Omnitrophica bacterium]|nr:ribosome maturation factor RimP [Candidatus Omnitrophota bacterium]
MTPQDEQRLIDEIASLLAQARGLELVELKVGRHKNDVLIQVLADKPQGGINLEDCSLLNRAIVEVIDKKGFFGEDNYSLEVASPGLDRPLLTYKDFLRNLNSEIRLWLKEQVAGKKEYVGVVISASPDVLTLLTREQKEIIVPLGQIIKGILVI